MGRNKKRVYKKPNRVETIEKDLMMTRVAQGASYSAVGKEHGFHHEQVKRMWTALGEDEQKKYLAFLRMDHLFRSIRRVVLFCI